MKITKISIYNYRSIKEINELELDDFNVFVGQNNHGKTNLFEAIEWFFNAKSSSDDEHFNRDKSNQIIVELFFEGVEASDIEKLKTEASKTKIKNLLRDADSFSVRKTSSNHKKSYIINGEDKRNPQGLDTAINEFLPKLEYVNTKNEFRRCLQV
jgi:putative ATP-dependent endonuclease of the OLD family